MLDRERAFLAALSVALTASALGCGGKTSLDQVCTSNRDCPVNSNCVTGRCAPKKLRPSTGCRKDDECGSGKWCDIATGQCKAIFSMSGEPDAESPMSRDAGENTDPPDTGVHPADAADASSIPLDAMTPLDATTPPPDSGMMCTQDPQCAPPGRICEGGRCVNGCTIDATRCGAGTVCNTTTGRCDMVSPGCRMDSECGSPARVCEATQCVPGCGQPGGIQCSGATPRCNTATGRCVAPPPCTQDTECSAPTPICVSMRCVARCDGPSGVPCSGGTVCNPANGRCLPGQLNMGDACTIDTQCASRFCLGLTVAMMPRRICSDPCGRTSDCSLRFNCASVGGMGFCLHESVFSPPRSFSVPPGGACSMASNSCQSGWCNTADSRCMSTCSRPADCSPADGSNCFTYAHAVTGGTAYDNLCYQPATGGGIGASCRADGDCRSGVCSGATMTCARHCCSASDCGANETCAVYGISPTTGVKICVPRSPTAGGLGFGATCTMPSDCRSEVCAPIRPADMMSPRQCSSTCCRNTDCTSVLGAGAVCRPFNGPIANTLVGVCIPG